MRTNLFKIVSFTFPIKCSAAHKIFLSVYDVGICAQVPRPLQKLSLGNKGASAMMYNVSQPGDIASSSHLRYDRLFDRDWTLRQSIATQAVTFRELVPL